MRDVDELNRLLAETERELARLDARKAELLAERNELRQEKASFRTVREPAPQPAGPPSVTNESSQDAKIALLRSLFRGREDTYPVIVQPLRGI